MVRYRIDSGENVATDMNRQPWNNSYPITASTVDFPSMVVASVCLMADVRLTREVHTQKGLIAAHGRGDRGGSGG